MKQVKALPVCRDCNCVMFKKTVGKAEGWSCPECYTTRWNDGL
jgi:tRNA(Ile2) C34 agmatinyltransferase TiaS